MSTKQIRVGPGFDTRLVLGSLETNKPKKAKLKVPRFEFGGNF